MCRPAVAPFLFLAALAFAITPPLLTHDPYESWAVTTVRPEVLELNITMAASTALRQLGPGYDAIFDAK